MRLFLVPKIWMGRAKFFLIHLTLLLSHLRMVNGGRSE